MLSSNKLRFLIALFFGLIILLPIKTSTIYASMCGAYGYASVCPQNNPPQGATDGAIGQYASGFCRLSYQLSLNPSATCPSGYYMYNISQCWCMGSPTYWTFSGDKCKTIDHITTSTSGSNWVNLTECIALAEAASRQCNWGCSLSNCLSSCGSSGGLAQPNIPCFQTHPIYDSYVAGYGDSTEQCHTRPQGDNCATINYGNSGRIEVKKGIANDYKIGFIKFDLASGDNIIPAGSVVVNASLRIFAEGWDGKDDGHISLHQVTQNWNENSITWDNKPTYDSAFVDTVDFTLQDSTGYKYFDVTALVQSWVNNPNSNFGIALEAEGSGTRGYIISSSESVTKGPNAYPCLQVDIAASPTPTPTISPTPTPTTSTGDAWFQTINGDIHAHGDIDLPVPTGDYLATDGEGGYPGVVSYGGSFDIGLGSVSSTDWLANTSTSHDASYAYFYNLFGQPNLVDPPISGEVPDTDLSTDGIYAYNADIATPQSGWDIGTHKVIVVTSGKYLVKGKIRVDTDDGGSLLVLAQNGIGVSHNLVATGGPNNRLQGLFITSGPFYTSILEDFNFTETDSSQTLVIDGAVVADSVHLSRAYNNNNDPVETFRYDPGLVMNLTQLWYVPYTWQEI